MQVWRSLVSRLPDLFQRTWEKRGTWFCVPGSVSSLVCVEKDRVAWGRGAPCQMRATWHISNSYTISIIVPVELSQESSLDVGVGVVLGGVNNYIKGFMLHPHKDQRVCLLNALKLKRLRGEHWPAWHEMWYRPYAHTIDVWTHPSSPRHY